MLPKNAVTYAILTAGSVPSPPHLSLAPIHRRGWGSLYAALSRGEIDQDLTRDLLTRYPLVKHCAEDNPPVYAVDLTSWHAAMPRAAPNEDIIIPLDTPPAIP